MRTHGTMGYKIHMYTRHCCCCCCSCCCDIHPSTVRLEYCIHNYMVIVSRQYREFGCVCPLVLRPASLSIHSLLPHQTKKPNSVPVRPGATIATQRAAVFKRTMRQRGQKEVQEILPRARPIRPHPNASPAHPCQSLHRAASGSGLEEPGMHAASWWSWWWWWWWCGVPPVGV